MGIELLKKSTQVARNRELTILFLVSGLTWIVLWFPDFLYLLIFQSSEIVADVYKEECFRISLWFSHPPLFHLFSALNPYNFHFLLQTFAVSAQSNIQLRPELCSSTLCQLLFKKPCLESTVTLVDFLALNYPLILFMAILF